MHTRDLATLLPAITRATVAVFGPYAKSPMAVRWSFGHHSAQINYSS